MSNDLVYRGSEGLVWEGRQFVRRPWRRPPRANTNQYNYKRTEAVKDQFGKAEKSFADRGEDRLERTQDKRGRYYFSRDDEKPLMNVSKQ